MPLGGWYRTAALLLLVLLYVSCSLQVCRHVHISDQMPAWLQGILEVPYGHDGQTFHGKAVICMQQCIPL
jgi:hypothetical protein